VNVTDLRFGVQVVVSNDLIQARTVQYAKVVSSICPVEVGTQPGCGGIKQNLIDAATEDPNLGQRH
jgi:hypothetical protein